MVCMKHSTKVLGWKFNKCEIGADIIGWLAVEVSILNIQYCCLKKIVGRNSWLLVTNVLSCICQKLLSQFRTNAYKIKSWILSDCENWFPKLSLSWTTAFYISSTVCNNAIPWILKLRLYYFNLLLYFLLPSSFFPSDLYTFIEILVLFWLLILAIWKVCISVVI